MMYVKCSVSNCVQLAPVMMRRKGHVEGLWAPGLVESLMGASSNVALVFLIPVGSEPWGLRNSAADVSLSSCVPSPLNLLSQWGL